MGKFLYEQPFAHPYETLQPVDSLTPIIFVYRLPYKSRQCEVWEPIHSAHLADLHHCAGKRLDLTQDLETGRR